MNTQDKRTIAGCFTAANEDSPEVSTEALLAQAAEEATQLIGSVVTTAEVAAAVADQLAGEL